MLNDTVELRINNQSIKTLLSYSIDSDIYLAASAFHVRLADFTASIRKAMLCEIYVNSQRVLAGVIDTVEDGYDKERGQYKELIGRDLMGWVVDSYCEDFTTTEGTTLKSLAEKLLAKIPYVSLKNITYEENFSGKVKKLSKKQGSTAQMYDLPHAFTRIAPRMRVFEALKSYAQSRGLTFFSLPSGQFVFGRPRSEGNALFSLTIAKTGAGSAVLSVSRRDTIEGAYSTYRVIGQQQTSHKATGPYDPGLLVSNTGATLTDPDFPYAGYSGPPLHKPYVEVNNNDYQSPALHCQLLLNKARHAAFKIAYRVPGHAQGAVNWTVNELCRVDDTALNPPVHDTYLVFGRTFEMSKDAGTTTLVRLGTPGYMEEGTEDVG